MSIIHKLKEKVIEIIKLSEYGNRKFYQIKTILGKNLTPDIIYPELISIEVSSICSLSCSHCPPHMKEYSEQTRRHSHIDYALFSQIMMDIDKHGKHEIALHKDGEPLIHPQIKSILERVKQNVPHVVYLTTNAHNLNQEIIETLLKSKIDVLNFSIGANSEEFYKKVRGKGFRKVIKNIHQFLLSVEKSDWKPKVYVQIIDLPEYQEMNAEIKAFRKYWENYKVEILVWKKLTWGVLKNDQQFRYRYPCYSLWHSFNINSNGIVTACCMDWKQELVIGNVNNQKIQQIWNGTELKELRQKHINRLECEINACYKCNYWKWQPMLLNYKSNI